MNAAFIRSAITTAAAELESAIEAFGVGEDGRQSFKVLLSADSGNGGGGAACCWTTALVKVSVKGDTPRMTGR